MIGKLVILNPKGATLRTAPSTSGGVIKPVQQGEVYAVEAQLPPTPSGDVWVKVEGMYYFQGKQAPGYVALNVAGVPYGVIIAQENLDELQRKINAAVKAALVEVRKTIDEMMARLG